MHATTLLASFALLAGSTLAHNGEHHGSETTMSHSSAAAGSAGPCPEEMAQNLTKTFDDGEYFSSCAEGADYTVKGLQDVTKLPDKDFAAFCGSMKCLDPLHAALGEYTNDECTINYKGEDQNLFQQLDDIHAECHKVNDAGGSDAHEDAESGSAGSDEVESADDGSDAATITVLSTSVSVVAAAVMLL